MSGYCPDCGNTMCICKDIAAAEEYVNDQSQKIGAPREWTLMGAWFDDNGRPGYSGVAIARCEGPLLKRGERISVIDISAYVLICAQLERAMMALNSIASWSEGKFVGPSFDEPGSANEARIAIREIEGMK